jgi:diamine N-acetyltransferase
VTAVAPALTLRRAVPADAEALGLLGGATFLAAFAHDHPGDALLAHVRAAHAPAWYEARLADPAWALWIVETPLRAPIGYAVAGPPKVNLPVGPDDWELLRIYALPGWQGAGLGRRLLEAVEAEARRRGAARLLLCVYTANVGAQRFYLREGFADTGAIQTFLVGDAPFEDRILAKSLA